jgi:ribose-phosphate pyrophosphokinase
VERARALAKRLKAGLAIIDKRREGNNVAVFMHLIGDVKDKDVVIADDMIDTAGTLIQAVDALRREGARRILACAVHGVLSDRRSPGSRSPCSRKSSSRTRSRSPPSGSSPICAFSRSPPLLAEAIRRIHDEESVSTLFV